MTPNALVSAATHVAGHCEAVRLLPVSVTICGEKANMAQFLGLALQYLAYGKVVEAVGGLTPPETLYPALSVPELIEAPIARDAYLLNLCAPLLDQVRETDPQPAIYHVSEGANEQGELRFAEAVYWVACVLRGLAWFGDLPQLLHRNIVSPAGLVPWAVPAELSHYLTALEESSLTGDTIPSNRPDVFNFSQTLRARTDAPSDPYRVARRVYDLAHWNGKSVAYYLGGCQFEAPGGSIWDRVRFFRFNSSSPASIATLLLRSLGMPASVQGAVWIAPPHRPSGYPEDCDGWSNINPHFPFGAALTAPGHEFYSHYENCSAPPVKVGVPPAPRDDQAVVIGSYMKAPKQEQGGRPMRVVFVSPWDVAMMGATALVEAASAGRFDAVVLTIIDADGWIYFAGSGATGDEHPTLTQEALGLVKVVRGAGLKFWVSVSTCANERRRKAWPSLKLKFGAVPDADYQYQPPQWLDPCADKYWDWLGDRVLRGCRVLQPDGIVFTHHYYPNLNGDAYWKVGWWDNGPSGTCQPWEPWSGGVATSLLTQRVKELVGVAARGGVAKTGICSFPVRGDGGNWPKTEVATWEDVANVVTYNTNAKPIYQRFGYQDIPALQQIVDHVVYVIAGSKWLGGGMPVWSRVIADHSALTGRAACVSLELADDWRAGPGLWRGVFRTLASAGAGGLAFHSSAISSGTLGVGGRAYTASGWATLARSGPSLEEA